MEIVSNPQYANQIGLKPEQLLIILLNPASISCRTNPGTPDYQSVVDEIRQATMFSTLERTRAQGKPLNLSDSLKRVRQIEDELTAWHQLSTMPYFVECSNWSHFEFRYHQPAGNEWDARRELAAARETLLAAVSKNAPIAFPILEKMKVVRSVEEILGLSGIV